MDNDNLSNGMVVAHINNNRRDNRKCNLRICTQQENCMNLSLKKNGNSSGIKGVSYRKDRNQWRARITYKNKVINLGSYNNKEDAIIARLKAEKEYFGEFSNQQELFKKYNI